MKRTLVMALALSAFGCSEPTTTPSGDVSSGAMYASIFTIDDGNETTVIAQLRTASNNQYPDVYLEQGDTLYASSIGSSTDINQDELASFGGARQISDGIKLLQHRDVVINDFVHNTHHAPEYAATFQQSNDAGSRYYLTLERERYNSIRDIPIRLPAPFALSTKQATTVDRPQDLTLSWIPSSDGTDTMSYQSIWFCEDEAGTVGYTDPVAIADSGSLSVSQPVLPAAPCALTIVIYREKVDIETALSSRFGLGQLTRGVQRRHLTFYSLP